MIFMQSFYHVPYRKVHVQIYSSLLYVRKKLRITGEWRSAPRASNGTAKKGCHKAYPCLCTAHTGRNVLQQPFYRIRIYIFYFTRYPPSTGITAPHR